MKATICHSLVIPSHHLIIWTWETLFALSPTAILFISVVEKGVLVTSAGSWPVLTGRKNQWQKAANYNTQMARCLARGASLNARICIINGILCKRGRCTMTQQMNGRWLRASKMDWDERRKQKKHKQIITATERLGNQLQPVRNCKLYKNYSNINNGPDNTIWNDTPIIGCRTLR